MSKQRTNTDWDAVELDYRAGLLSIVAIGKKHGVSESMVRKHAAKRGWIRDLSEQVVHATKAKLVRGEVRGSGASAPDYSHTDAEVIEAASSEAASVIMAHRADLAVWAGIAARLGNALQGMEINEDNHGDFARSLNAGVDAQLKVIKGQRQAYNLDEASTTETYEQRLARLMEADK